MKIEEIIKEQLSKVVNENQTKEENYMFFSNLDQIERQCKMLRSMDSEKIDELLSQGHDWADDHMTEAKSLMDQVFDFIMNELKGNGDEGVPVKADMSQFSMNEEELQEKCWDGYKQVGGKMKNGKMVPKCVPVNESEEIDEGKNKPTNPKLWAACLAWARSKYKVCPSAYCNGAAAKRYKQKGGGWRKSKK